MHALRKLPEEVATTTADEPSIKAVPGKWKYEKWEKVCNRMKNASTYFCILQKEPTISIIFDFWMLPKWRRLLKNYYRTKFITITAKYDVGGAREDMDEISLCTFLIRTF